jgi:hypothetical protein
MRSSGTGHDPPHLHELDGIRGAGSYAPTAADTAAVVRAEHTAAMLPDAVLPAEMGTGPALLTEDIIDYRTIGIKTEDTGIIGLDEQRFPLQVNFSCHPMKVVMEN